MIPSERRPLRKLAIVVGVIIGFAGSIITVFAVIVAAGIVVGAQGGTVDEAATERWFQEPVPLLAFELISVLWLVAGAFAAAKIAGRDHLRHGAWTGAGALAVAIVTLALPFQAESPIPWWSNVLGLVLTIPASILGAYFAQPANVAHTPR